MPTPVARRSCTAVLVAGLALAGCGSDDGEEALMKRLRSPGCTAQARAATYATVGLREITPPGATAKAFQADIEKLVASASDKDRGQVREFVHVLSLGDGDHEGELGEVASPDDPEDVGVLFAPPVPTSHEQALDLTVQQYEAAARASAAKEGVAISVASTVTADAARVTARYGSGKSLVAERYGAAFTPCSFVKVVGWPTQVEKVLSQALSSRP